MECPANCPIYKRNMELEEQIESLKKKHAEDIEKIREMLVKKQQE